MITFFRFFLDIFSMQDPRASEFYPEQLVYIKGTRFQGCVESVGSRFVYVMTMGETTAYRPDELEPILFPIEHFIGDE